MVTFNVFYPKNRNLMQSQLSGFHHFVHNFEIYVLTDPHHYSISQNVCSSFLLHQMDCSLHHNCLPSRYSFQLYFQVLVFKHCFQLFVQFLFPTSQQFLTCPQDTFPTCLLPKVYCLLFNSNLSFSSLYWFQLVLSQGFTAQVSFSCCLHLEDTYRVQTYV